MEASVERHKVLHEFTATAFEKTRRGQKDEKKETLNASWLALDSRTRFNRFGLEKDKRGKKQN